MPRKNRVTPFSTLIETSARGTLTGNRGCLHDDHQHIQRQFQGTRWIICLLEFKNRKRAIMTQGHYTELFFLDEATALAAGHRPCAECQRERFNLFREIWAKANPELAGKPRPAATTLDAALHRERLAIINHGDRFSHSIENWPDGTFVTDDEQNAYLVMRSHLLHWIPAGYELPNKTNQYPLRLLTPDSVVRTLAAGYPVRIHPSAFDQVNSFKNPTQLG
jgi:hypothetical protein